MTTNRYEFRVAGLLTERAKDAGVLALLQTMGLHVVAMTEVPE